MGRPQSDIDPAVVENLAQYFCSRREIAAVVGCDPQTITNRFSAEYDKGREQGKTLLRQKQWEAVKKGNVAMMIWLGKQYLGQTDKSDVTTRDETPTPKVTELLVTTRAQAKAVMAQQSGNGNGNGKSGNGDAGLPGAGRIPG